MRDCDGTLLTTDYRIKIYTVFYIVTMDNSAFFSVTMVTVTRVSVHSTQLPWLFF